MPRKRNLTRVADGAHPHHHAGERTLGRDELDLAISGDEPGPTGLRRGRQRASDLHGVPVKVVANDLHSHLAATADVFTRRYPAARKDSANLMNRIRGADQASNVGLPER
jgi:hypothetical protein